MFFLLFFVILEYPKPRKKRRNKSKKKKKFRRNKLAGFFYCTEKGPLRYILREFRFFFSMSLFAFL